MRNSWQARPRQGRLFQNRECFQRRSEVSCQLLNHDLRRLFMINHNTKSASTNTRGAHDVWFIDLSASNHMTSHGERFQRLQTPRGPTSRRRVTEDVQLQLIEANEKSWKMVSRVANTLLDTLDIHDVLSRRRNSGMYEEGLSHPLHPSRRAHLHNVGRKRNGGARSRRGFVWEFCDQSR